jgi:hypothetical protein
MSHHLFSMLSAANSFAMHMVRAGYIVSMEASKSRTLYTVHVENAK